MKFKSIEFINNQVLGNVLLDFKDSHGNPVNTIIFAGENGTGKSTILEVIYSLTAALLTDKMSEEERIYEIQLSKEEIKQLLESHSIKRMYPTLKNLSPDVKIIQNFSLSHNWGTIKVELKDDDGTDLKIPADGFLYATGRSLFRALFSDVAVNFISKTIHTVTSMNIDDPSANSERSLETLASDIAQLLIDIQSQDALDFSEWGRNNSTATVDQSKLDVRMKRFTSAFETIFPSKRYKGVVTENGEKKIKFIEHGKEMTVNQLSSGEKQIVIRGSFLLKNQKQMNNTIVLIDEPEISLHPHWQLNILNYYKKLFINDQGEQTSQLFISTHSPFILHNAARSADKVLVLNKDENGVVSVLDHPVFPGWTGDIAIEQAFDASAFISSKKNIVFLEGVTDEQYFKETVSLYYSSGIPVEFVWIGRVRGNGQHENTGDSALNHAKQFFQANSFMMESKIVLLYDSDTNKPNEDLGKLLVRKMDQNPENTLYTIGVENLLSLPAQFDFGAFYSSRKKIDPYGAESLLRELDKQNLCDYVCKTLNKDEKLSCLANVKKEIEKILHVV